MITNAKIIGANVDVSDYHYQAARRGDKSYVMSRSELTTFAQSPSKWINGWRFESTDATEWGSLMDTLVTMPHTFDKQFAIKPETYTNEKGEVKPWSGNAKVCQAWADEQGHKTVIKSADKREAQKAMARMMKDPYLSEFIQCSAKQVMVTADYQDLATGLVVPLKGLIDLVPDAVNEWYGRSLGDFKTARNAHPDEWKWVVWKMGYHVQAALYLDMYCAARPDEDRQEFRHVISENESPYEPARRWLDLEMIQEGRKVYCAALARYCQSLASNSWPAWDDMSAGLIEGWTQISLEPRMIANISVEIADKPETKQDDKERIDILH